MIFFSIKNIIYQWLEGVTERRCQQCHWARSKCSGAYDPLLYTAAIEPKRKFVQLHIKHLVSTKGIKKIPEAANADLLYLKDGRGGEGLRVKVTAPEKPK